MKRGKIINDQQIKWHGKESSRLSYQMIFEEESSSKKNEQSSDEEPDIEALLEERDKRWREKLREARESAYKKGVEEGLKQGLKEARSEIDGKLGMLEEAYRQAHKEWSERQDILETGMLDLIFDIAEKILGIPVKNTAIRDKLDLELRSLLQKVDGETRPLLWISEEDFEYIDRLKEDFSSQTPVYIKTDKDLKPGEFILETNSETVVHKFETMLDDFKDSLSLPSWNQ